MQALYVTRAMAYTPNEIPLKVRLFNTLAAVFLLVYGGVGVYKNYIYIPSKRNNAHLHDEPALLMFAAMVCGSLVLLSVVVDHYDKRNNERSYQLFARALKWLGWLLFFASLLVAGPSVFEPN